MFVMKSRADYEELKTFTEAKEEVVEKNLKEKLSNENIIMICKKFLNHQLTSRKNSAEEMTKSKISRIDFFGITILERLETDDEISQKKKKFQRKLPTQM